MVKNIWSQIKIFCTEHVDEKGKPVWKPLIEDEYGHPVFICACHFPKTEKNKYGYEEGEEKCMNSVSFEDCQKVVHKFQERLEQDYMSRVESNYVGMRLPHKKYDVKVIHQSEEHFFIGFSRKNRNEY